MTTTPTTRPSPGGYVPQGPPPGPATRDPELILPAVGGTGPAAAWDITPNASITAGIAGPGEPVMVGVDLRGQAQAEGFAVAAVTTSQLRAWALATLATCDHIDGVDPAPPPMSWILRQGPRLGARLDQLAEQYPSLNARQLLTNLIAELCGAAGHHQAEPGCPLETCPPCERAADQLERDDLFRSLVSYVDQIHAAIAHSCAGPLCATEKLLARVPADVLTDQPATTEETPEADRG